MRTRQYFLKAAAAALTLGFVPEPAVASPPNSGPRALGVRVSCADGARGTRSNLAAWRAPGACAGLDGWFEGRFDWVSGGRVLFREEGSFVALSDDAGAVHLYLDANHDQAAFDRVYGGADPQVPSVLTAPDLHTRLYVRDLEGRYNLVAEEPYRPIAMAVMAARSRDTDGLRQALHEEQTARARGDLSVHGELDQLERAQRGAHDATTAGLVAEVEARKQRDVDLGSAAREAVTGYAYSRTEIDGKVAAADSMRPTLGAGAGLTTDDLGATPLTLDPSHRDGSAYDARFVRQAPAGGTTRIASDVVIDGTLITNGAIEISRPDGSVRIGHGSSILELIGADPYVFPVAPSPTIYFSPDTLHQLNAAVQSPVPQRQQVQFGILNNQSNQVQVQNNPKQQIPTYPANNSSLLTVGVLAIQNAQLQAGPHVVPGVRGEIRLAGAIPVGLNPAYTGFTAPPTPAANFLYTMPSGHGLAGQPWVNDGSGGLTWITLNGDIINAVNNNKVIKLQGTPVTPTWPSVNGQILHYSTANARWEPSSNLILPGNALIGVVTGGGLGVTGTTTLSNTLTVAGATSINNTLNVTGNTSLGARLTVTGRTTLNNTLRVVQATNLASTLGVTQATTMSSSLTTGAAAPTILNNTLVVTGPASLSPLNVLGLGTFQSSFTGTRPVQLNNTLTVAQGSTLNGGLTVGGNTVLSNTLSVTGNASFSSPLTGALSGNFGSLRSNGAFGIGGKYTGGGFGSFGTTGYFGSGVTVASGNLSVTGSGTFGASVGVGGSGSFGGALTANGTAFFNSALTTGALQVNGSTSIAGDNNVTSQVAIGSVPMTYRVNVGGDIYTTGFARINSSNVQYFQDYGGGWTMTDTVWIRAYANKSVLTSGTVEANTLRGDSQICIGTDCRSAWPGGYDCNLSGATNSFATCGSPRLAGASGTVAWSSQYDYTDYLPARDASEHWYQVRFTPSGSTHHPRIYFTDGTRSLPNPPGWFNAVGNPYYRFDVFTDCNNSVRDRAGLDPGVHQSRANGWVPPISPITPEPSDTDCNNDSTNRWVGKSYWETTWVGGTNRPNYGYNAGEYYYVRVRPLGIGNRACIGYRIVFAQF